MYMVLGHVDFRAFSAYCAFEVIVIVVYWYLVCDDVQGLKKEGKNPTYQGDSVAYGGLKKLGK